MNKLLLGFVLLLAVGCGQVPEITIQDNQQMMTLLQSGQAQGSLEKVIAKADYYTPPIIFQVSRVLFEQEKKEEAAFWFYVAQLRARYDANRTLDPTAASGVAVLNQAYGGPINQWVFADDHRVRTIPPEAIEYVREHPDNYDPNWLTYHGMDAFSDDFSPKLAPEAEWAEIKQQTIEDYEQGFQNMLESLPED